MPEPSDVSIERRTRLARLKRLQRLKDLQAGMGAEKPEERDLRATSYDLAYQIDQSIAPAEAISPTTMGLLAIPKDLGSRPEPVAAGPFGLARNAVRFLHGLASEPGEALKRLHDASLDTETIWDRLPSEMQILPYQWTKTIPAKFFEELGGEVKGIAEFAGHQIVNLAAAIHPVYWSRALNGDKEAQKTLESAQEQIWETGGLGPIVAIHMTQAIPRALRRYKSAFADDAFTPEPTRPTVEMDGGEIRPTGVGTVVPPDPLMPRARALAEPTIGGKPQVTASLLVKELDIGYIRATEMMKRLRDEGLVEGEGRVAGAEKAPAKAGAAPPSPNRMLWEVSKEEIMRLPMDLRSRMIMLKAQRDAVLRAVRDGKQVDPRILAEFENDFPTLAKRGKQIAELEAQRAGLAEMQPTEGPTSARLAAEIASLDKAIETAQQAIHTSLRAGEKRIKPRTDLRPGEAFDAEVADKIRARDAIVDELVEFADRRKHRKLTPEERIERITELTARAHEATVEIHRREALATTQIADELRRIEKRETPPPEEGSRSLVKGEFDELTGKPGGEPPKPVKIDPEVAAAFNLDEIKEPPVHKEPFVGQYLVTPSNYLSATPDRFPRVVQVWENAAPNLLPHNPRFGDMAAAIEQQIILADFTITREVRRLTEAAQEIFSQIPKSEFGKSGEAFYDAIAGVPIEKILARTDISDGMKKAAVMTKEFYENIKQDYLQWKRDDLRKTARRQAEVDFRKTYELKGKKLTEEQRAMIDEQAEGLLKEWVRDDWGHPDYLPQYHIGEFVARYKGERFATVNSKIDLKQAILEHHLDALENGIETKVADYTKDVQHFMPPDMTRITRRNKRRIAKALADDMDLTPEQTWDAMRGKLGTHADRARWFRSFEHRKGTPGFSKDVPFIFNRYIWGYVNAKHLTKLNRQIMPAIEAMERQGRTGLAGYVRESFQQLWGMQYGYSKMFDKWRMWMDKKIEGLPVVGKIPWLRMYHAPFMLDRSAARFRTVIKNVYLDANPGFHIRNNLQVIQILAPILGEEVKYFLPALRAKGGKFLLSGEDLAIIERHGIQYITGGKMAEASSFFPGFEKARRKMTAIREKAGVLAAEASNQEVAFLTMYRWAREKLNMTDQNAANFALLRGNLYTQFAFLRSDRPKFTRGPIPATAFLFQRFRVKAVEMLVNEWRSKRRGSVFKWAGIQLALGGPNALLRLGGILGLGYLSKKLYDYLKDEFGEQTADALHYGLAGAFGTDQSYALQITDMPYGETVAEQFGRLMGGVPYSFAFDMHKAWTDRKGPYPTTPVSRAARQITKRVPAFRWVDALDQLGQDADAGLYDFTDAAGRTKFRADLTAVWLQAANLRPVEAGHEDMLVEAIADVIEKRDRVLDEAAHDMLRGGAPSFNNVHQWNAQFPEFPIFSDAIITRTKARLSQQGLTRSERMLQRAPKAVKEGFKEGFSDTAQTVELK